MKRETSILIAWLAMQIPLALIAPSFYRSGNLRDVVLSNVPVLVAAIGMTMVILIRQIDVSIGAQFAVCAIAAGMLAKTGLPMPLVAVVVLVVGALLGSLNGLLVGLVKLPSIVVTLAAMVVLRDAIRWITEGAWVQNLPAGFQWFGLGQSGGEWLMVAIAALSASRLPGLCDSWRPGARFMPPARMPKPPVSRVSPRAPSRCSFSF